MKTALTIFGVEGTLTRDDAPRPDGLYAIQKWVAKSRPIPGGDKYEASVRPEIRFDDSCRNGHMSFAITGTTYESSGREAGGGCVHEQIAKAFPELAPLIKWHLMDTSGPMHYIANTVYHASNRDHWGLLKDERRQIVNGKTKQPAWHLAWIDNGVEKPLHEMPKQMDGEKPASNPVVAWVPWCHVGEGKARDFAAARSCAVWPEATDEELSADPATLKAALLARAPALCAAFRADVEAAGLTWAEPVAAKAESK